MNSPIGLTLSEYAEHRGTSPKAAREPYSRMMRYGDDVELPPVTRSNEIDGLHKFCLSVGEFETESVVIPMSGHHGNNWHTLCVSSQIGCRMACTFCETGRMGLLANLSAAQIVAQRLAARQFIAPRPPQPGGWRYNSDGIRNIVFMGMGEPLDNFDAVAQAVRVLSEPAGLNIPLTQITVSTVGRVDGIRKLGALGARNLRLAVSLNAANDALRDTLMPINKGTPLKELQRTLIDYPLPKKSFFMIEYVVIKGVNDSLADADQVAEWCRPLRCAVNLIPYNPQSGASYESPDETVMFAFLERLKYRGQFVKWRVTKGRGLMGACGQLGNPELRRRPALRS